MAQSLICSDSSVSVQFEVLGTKRLASSAYHPPHYVNTLRYGTIRYIYVRSKTDVMASLFESTAQKQK